MFDGNKMTKSIGRGDVQAVKFWLKFGMNPDAIDDEGNTALGLALHVRRFDIVKVLLEGGANPNMPVRRGSSVTPLELAVRMDRLDILEALLEHGANPRVTGSGGKTPVDVAREKGLDDVVELLERYA